MTSATGARASVAYDACARIVLEQMRAGRSMRTASGLAGCSHEAVRYWIAEGEKDPDGRYGEFARAIRAAQAAQIAEAEDIHRAHREQNPAAVQWWLARMDRDTYGDAPVVVVQQPEALPDATPDDVAKALGK